MRGGKDPRALRGIETSCPSTLIVSRLVMVYLRGKDPRALRGIARSKAVRLSEALAAVPFPAQSTLAQSVADRIVWVGVKHLR